MPVAYDGFDYPAPDVVVGQSGGTGDWKNPWSGDAEIGVVLGGYGYTDSLGSALAVGGNHIELSAALGPAKKVERQLNDPLGTGASTIWMSAILDGSGSGEIHNVSLGDGVFFGQGGKDSGGLTWQLSDQAGLVGDTGLSAAGRAFLVVRIDFTAGDESVWLWVDPVLGATPDIASSAASGALPSFQADFVRAQLQSAGAAGFDELRIGTTFADVAPVVLVPEPGTGWLVLIGMLALAWLPPRIGGSAPNRVGGHRERGFDAHG